MKKRVFALLLCLIMCLSLLPVSAFADDCSHEIVLMPAKVTCGEAYREHYKCTRCGKLFSDPKGEYEISAESVAQAKPVHTSDLLHVDAELDITCIKGGNAEYWVCPECGQMFSENPGVTEEGVDNRRTRPISDDKIKDYIFPALGHIVNPEIVPAVPHDCWNNGTIAHYSCDRCGAAFADPAGQEQLYDITDYTPGHSKIEYPEVRHTCDTDGNYYYFYCDVCGNYYDINGMQIEEGSWVDPARHDYVEHPASEPTCMSEGNVFYYSCENCGKVFDADKNETTLDAVTIPKVPHSLTIHVDAVPKTCYTDGNIEYWQCDSCYTCFADAEGTVPVESVEVPASHEFVATEAKEPTCTEDGNIAYKTCTVEGCGVVVDENGNPVWSTVIPATGHKPEKVESTATCTEAGVAEHYKCTACGKLFKDALCTEETTLEELAVEPLGHDYDMDGWCTRCGAISPDTPEFDAMSYVSVPTPQGAWKTVIVRVSAPQGVFPAGSQLSAQIVLDVDDETEAAVDAVREEGANPTRSYTFDIKVLNRYGFEVQPADDSKVNVSFELAEAANKNLDAKVYHVIEAEDGSISAEALETSVDNENETVVVETDGFSRYRLEFTGEAKEPYVLSGDESVALETILNKVLEDPNPPFEIVDVKVKDEDKPYFEAKKNDSEVWTVFSYRPFSDEKTMIVTLRENSENNDYTIKVTDAAAKVKVTEGKAYTEGQTKEQALAVIDAEENKTVYVFTTLPTEQFYQWTYQIPSGKTIEGFDTTKAETSFKMPTGITADDTFQFTAVKKYAVTFDKNGHGTDTATQYVAPNGHATRPTAPVDVNYVFGNWYEDAACTKIFDFANTAITKDTTVYAKWRCQVTFSTEHGTAPTTQTVDINGKATKPSDLKWIGYIWRGWCTDTEWKNAFDFNTPITANTVLYARWDPDLKITKGDGGTAHYGSTYAFTLNYYYPDYNKNSSIFKVYVAKKGDNYATVLSKEHYVVTQDETKRAVVTLKASYIRTLTDGATYYILFDTGLPVDDYPPYDLGAVEGTFKVSKSPKTGDESNVGLWIAIAAVSAVAVIAIIAYLLHKRKKSKLPPTPPEKVPENEKKTKKPPKE